MTHDLSAVQERQLGDFSNVDQADSGDLVARLDAMHALDSFRVYKKETFDLLRLKPGASVADVGCGTGEDVRSLYGRVVPGGQAVGFDLSEAMLSQARERHAGLPGLEFRQSSADALDAPDEAFDAVRVDRVLIHVPDPLKALNELIRVTKPGGRIVISEPDMPGCWAASSDYAVTDRIMRAIAGSCVTPYLARDLYALFKDAGLTDVSLEVRSVTASDPASVSRILDFAGVVNGMLSKGLLAQEEAEAWIGEFVERGKTGRFVAGVSIMIAAGTKP